MEWKQTNESVTFSFQVAPSNLTLGYELCKVTDTKIMFRIIFKDDTIAYELNIGAALEWPPTWTRNLITMKAEFTFTKREKMPWPNYGTHVLVDAMVECGLEFREYQVISNEPLSNLTHLLVVRPKDFLQIVPIGRCVLAQLSLRSTTSRPYNPVPPCLHPDDMASNYTTDCLCFMIKKYPDGALSPSITALQVGQTLHLSQSVGSFAIGNYDNFSVIHMLAAGTGLTVMLGIIQRALVRGRMRTINLLHFNKDEESIFYEQQLEKISGQKLKVTHILSQPKSTWTGKRGMVSRRLLKALVGKRNPDACVFICGPKLFSQNAQRYLRYQLGWKPHQMYQFE
ncbi:hypothetical protein K0M31_012845 [Melipona bicolor]|uniref:FAD-binding FR-type domain-containing protein n=1 Tax=Melipona bicolor TaxID=60889 RepID=A0AA40KHD1_9HYME|nr:hypothetical protein K0M31_012845 [Melipona bicolor]